MQKIVFLTFAIASFNCFSSELIHPLDFGGTKIEKNKVILFVKETVKKTYTAIGMGDSLTLRMMEKEELNSFKKLTKVKSRELLDSVINQYCGIGMCNYNTIFMMYREQSNASKRNLEW